MSSKDNNPKLGSAAKGLPRKKFIFTSEALNFSESRAVAAARLVDMVQQFKELDVELGALHGGAVADLMDEFGLGQTDNRTIGKGRMPTEGMSIPGTEDDLFDVGLPRQRSHRSTAGLGAPSPKDAMAGAAGYGMRTPVPGQSTQIHGPGGKAYSTLFTDGTRVTVGEGWRGGNYHVFTRTENADGESNTTTVVITPDGRSATFTDHTPGGQSNAPTTTAATGDPDVIQQEQDRREEGGGDQFDEAPPTQPTQPAQPQQPQTLDITVDPDAPNQGSVWGYYNPFTGQYWGPARKTTANQVNPGRDNTVTPSEGPNLAIDPKTLVVNPNPEAMQGRAQPKLRTPRDIQNTPGVRPPKPDEE